MQLPMADCTPLDTAQVLYKLHLGEAVTTSPTVGSNVEQIQFRNLTFDVGPLLSLLSCCAHACRFGMTHATAIAGLESGVNGADLGPWWPGKPQTKLGNILQGECMVRFHRACEC